MTLKDKIDAHAVEVCTDNCAWESNTEEYNFGHDMYHEGAEFTLSELMPVLIEAYKTLEAARNYLFDSGFHDMGSVNDPTDIQPEHYMYKDFDRLTKQLDLILGGE